MDYNADRGRSKNLHGWARALFGQHLHRTPLAVLEARGCVFARLNDYRLAPVRGFDYLAKVITGVTFKDGIETTTQGQIAA